MPYILPTRCGDPMCGELATNRGRCDRHQRQPWGNPSANGRALTGADRRRWHNLVFKTHGDRCVDCGAEAVIADHITPIADGGALMDPANGRPLCAACDRSRTQEQNIRRRR